MLVRGISSCLCSVSSLTLRPQETSQRQALATTDLLGAAGRPPSSPELGALAVSELSKRLQRLGPVWKQIEARLFIPLHPDAAAANQMIDPVGFDPHGRGDLRYGQGAQDPTRARPRIALETTMPQPNQSHGTGPQLRVVRRAHPLERQKLVHLLIRFPLAYQT